MKNKSKFYLANILKDINKKYYKDFKEGKTIYFEMPPFCSGDYKAKIHKDKLGLYIDSDDNYFNSCRGWEVLK